MEERRGAQDDLRLFCLCPADAVAQFIGDSLNLVGGELLIQPRQHPDLHQFLLYLCGLHPQRLSQFAHGHGGGQLDFRVPFVQHSAHRLRCGDVDQAVGVLCLHAQVGERAEQFGNAHLQVFR